MILRVSVLILALISLNTVSSAQVYRYVDENGRVIYSSSKPAGIEKANRVRIRHNFVSSSETFDETISKEVIIYTTSWCSVCKRAKDYLEGQGIDYSEFDVETDAKGKRDYAQMRGRGVPIILVDGQRMNGFDEERFQRLYNLNE